MLKVVQSHNWTAKLMQSDRAASDEQTRLFVDIEHHWAKSCIAALAKRNLIKGNPNGQFRPDAPITRGEFAALMYWVFPRSVPVRESHSFDDVPVFHWASKVVRWVHERGFFSGYVDRTFRPDETLSRSQAFVVLVNGLNYVLPLFPQPILEDYFDDAADVPAYAKNAIATATLASLVVNYPEVRKLRPNQPITRGEVAAVLCQIFEQPHPIPQQYVTWSSDLAAIQGAIAVPFELLKGNARLVKQIQTRLHALQLYPNEVVPDGSYDPLTEAALIEFCQILELPHRYSYQMDATLAQLLLNLEPVCFRLRRARDREKIFNYYLQQEQGFGAAKLAFLDHGIHGSPYEAEVKNYPTYLLHRNQHPQVTPVVHSASTSTGKTALHQAAMGTAKTLTLFPNRGELPALDAAGLSFLHPDIQQACICIGDFSTGQLQTRWLSKNALANVELWSATKIIPLLNVVCKANSFSTTDIDQGVIRAGRGSREFSFYDLAIDIMNYESTIGSSNALAAMFKQFETPQNLENWLKAITGNANLTFRGRYGEGTFMQAPQLWDQQLQKVILTASATHHRGNNSISTYDLTRLITMLAWHPFLPATAQFPGAQWHSLESLIRAMGADSARYIDVAIEQLGMANVIAAPVIISKLGFGRSSIRERTELVYTAFVQFLDQHQCSPTSSSQPARLRAVGMTLVAAKKLGNGDREATELDARMASEVTEILRRVVTEELL